MADQPQVARLNLSYEEIDTKLSYEAWSWLRLYAGVGFIVHRQPGNLGGTTQWGLELTSPTTFLGGRIRPVAYADFQCNERTNWDVEPIHSSRHPIRKCAHRRPSNPAPR